MRHISWRRDSSCILVAFGEQFIRVGASARYRSPKQVGSLDLVDAHADLVDPKKPASCMTSDREVSKDYFFRQWANPAFHFYVRRTLAVSCGAG